MPNNTCYIYVVFVHMLNIMQVHTADQNFWLVIDFHLLCYLSESPNCAPLSCVRSFGLFDLFAWTACIWCSFAKSFGLCCLRIAMISLRIVRTISLTIFIITRVSSHCHNHNQSISFILEPAWIEYHEAWIWHRQPNENWNVTASSPPSSFSNSINRRYPPCIHFFDKKKTAICSIINFPVQKARLWIML